MILHERLTFCQRCFACVNEHISLDAIPENPLDPRLDEPLNSDTDDDYDSDTAYYNDTGSLITNRFEQVSESGQSGVRLPLENLSLNNTASTSAIGSHRTISGGRRGKDSRASMLSTSEEFDPDTSSYFRSTNAKNANNPYVGTYRAPAPKKVSNIHPWCYERLADSAH